MGQVRVAILLLAVCLCLVGAEEVRGGSRRVKREALYIPPLVRPPTRSLSDNLPPLVAPRQIFSPRMGKDIDSQLARYARIPPIPKLDKTFDQYLSQYRRDDSYAYDDDSNDWLRQLLIARMRQRLYHGRQPWMVEQSVYGGEDEDQFATDDSLLSADKEDMKRGMSMLRMGRSAEDDSRAARPNVRMMRMG